MKWETYRPGEHDRNRIAELIFQTDKELSPLVYGNNPRNMIRELLDKNSGFFFSGHMRCAMLNDQIVGLAVIYPVEAMGTLNRATGQIFLDTIGFMGVIRKMPMLMKMAHMLGGSMDGDGLYLHTLCVDRDYRGSGIGSEILRNLASEHRKIYLHVNAKNKGAVHFYEKNGLVIQSHRRMRFKGKEYEYYLMKRG